VINSVVLVGRLGNDPELTYTQSGTAICKFRLAVSRPPRGDSGQGQSTERSGPVATSEKCPQCEGGTLQIREGRRGKFLGCSNYPTCTYSRDYDGDGGDGGDQAAAPAPAPREETDWLDIVAFGRTAEICNQYLDKGALAGIEGSVRSSTWEKQDGTRGYRVEIAAQRVQFLESRRDREARQAAHGGARPPQQGGNQQQSQQGAAPQGAAPQGAAPQGQQGGPDIDWTMDESEDPFGDQ